MENVTGANVLHRTMLLLSDTIRTATPGRQSLIEHGERYRSERFAGDNAAIKRHNTHSHSRQTIPDWTRRRQPVTCGFAQVWLDGSLLGCLHLSAVAIGRRHSNRNYLNTIFFTLNWHYGISADGFQIPHLRKAVTVSGNFTKQNVEHKK